MFILIPFLMFVIQISIFVGAITLIIKGIKSTQNHSQKRPLIKTEKEKSPRFEKQVLKKQDLKKEIKKEQVERRIQEPQQTLLGFLNDVKDAFKDSLEEDKKEEIFIDPPKKDRKYADHLGGSATSDSGKHEEAHLDKQVLEVEETKSEINDISDIKERTNVEKEVKIMPKTIRFKGKEVGAKEAFMLSELLKEPKCKQRKRATS